MNNIKILMLDFEKIINKAGVKSLQKVNYSILLLLFQENYGLISLILHHPAR